MFEKILVTLLKSASAVAYVFLMALLFAFPINFAVHAFLPPVLVTDEVKETVIESDDEFISSSGESADDWKRIDYSITAHSGWASPYEYLIEEFTVKNEEILSFAEDYKVFLDEPSSFTKDASDEMVISLYIKTSEDIDTEKLSSETEFKAKVYEKNFAQFKVKYGNGKLWK